jgi:hypothetical protein
LPLVSFSLPFFGCFLFIKFVRVSSSRPVSIINVTHIICEQCFYISFSVINVNNLNSALTLIHA